MALPRIHFSQALPIGEELDLPGAASRHIQVLRMQPGESVCLFPGEDPHSNQEYTATIVSIGRQTVRVQVQHVHVQAREIQTAVHLVVGMPTNDRMDWLIEKATELGVSSITPLMTERSVLRLKGERADKKREHWHAIAIAACEQSGRNTVPVIHPVQTLAEFIKNTNTEEASDTPLFKCVLSLTPDTQPLTTHLRQSPAVGAICLVSGPEGGLAPQEQDSLLANGFSAITLGNRILRAETAPLAALAHIALSQA